MKNNKGYIKPIMLASLILLIMIIIMIIMLGFDVNSFNKDMEKAKSLIESHVEDVEIAGLLNQNIKFNILKDLKENLPNYDIMIEGSEFEVDKGNEVFIVTTLKSENMMGGTLREETIFVEGVSKFEQ